MKRTLIICSSAIVAAILIATIAFVVISRNASVDAKKQQCAVQYPLGSFQYYTCIDRANG